MGGDLGPSEVVEAVKLALADAAIEQACGEKLQQTAATIGRTIRAEQGLDRAVALIRELWGDRI